MVRRKEPSIKTRADKVLGQVHDSEVYSLGSISSEHVMIHKGLSYTYSTYFPDLDTPSGGKFALFPTGSDYRAHFTLRGTVEGQAGRLTIYETGAGLLLASNGSDISGVRITPINRKRTSTNIAEMQVYEGAIVFRSGTKLVDEWIPAGNKLSAEISHTDEWYLAPNNYYLVSWIPDADNASGNVRLEWYEEQED